ncbi:DEAD/DEAH box helicase [Xanthomonas sacchari]
MPFASLGLSPALYPAFAAALARAGWQTPTPIQLQAVPLIVAGHDLLAMAQTGSGKTAAFALPLLQACAQADRPARSTRVLVLVPTRELAVQVADTFVALGLELPRRPRVVVAVGGVSINPQMLALRGGADVVVATPGRLLDLLAQRALQLDAVAHLVLDEADRLLDLGFGAELERLLQLLPTTRQTLLFSATLPAPIAALATRLLRAPRRIGDAADAAPIPATLRQRAIEVDDGRRLALLQHLLEQEAWPRALVFVASRRSAEQVATALAKAGIAAQPLHGDLAQGRRLRTLEAFRQQQLRVLVTTDLAARGIDIAALPVVVNYDLPRSTADYTHRIGRSARAGAEGQALSFVDAASAAHLRLIEKRQGVRVPRERIPGFEPKQAPPPAAAPATEAAASTGGIKGKRPSKKDRLRAARAQDGEPPASG